MKPYCYLMAGTLLGSLLTAGASAVHSEASPVQDPVRQSPQYYTVLLENDEVRVLEYRLGPGQKEPMHSHTSGVVYTLSDGRLRTTLADGTTTESALKAREAIWRTPVTHALENIGNTDVHALALELKRPSKP
jgi:quercetin dioxygenase-like cupin family protein